jgi:hypothetical protein
LKKTIPNKMGDDQFRVEMREDISQKIFAALKISNQATE